MKGLNKAEWALGEVLTDPQKLFVLWAVKERFCVSLDDFHNHYGPDFPIAKLVGDLREDGFLRQGTSELVLTETGEQAVAHLGDNEFSPYAVSQHDQQVHQDKITPLNISERVIKPEQCVFAFGIPLSKEDFLKDLNHPNKNFARKFHGVWERYLEEIVGDFEMIRPRLTELGVALYPKLTFEKFGALCQEGFDVIILFSHWEDDAIEFYDGFVDYKDIVEKIPGGFDGILDLTVCHPDQLVKALRRDRTQCLIRSIKEKKKLIPHYWLFFFLALFTHLKDCDLTYIRAVEDVVAEFRKKAERS